MPESTGGPSPLRLDLLAQKVRIDAPGPGSLRTLAQAFEIQVFDAADSDARSWDDPALRIELRPVDSPSEICSWDLETRPVDAFETAPRTPSLLVSALNSWAVHHTDRHYVFHAGAVAKEGQGVLMPAASFHGKSTLTAGLVQRGFDLLSDEVGAIDLASGRLVGYPRALSLRCDVLSILDLDTSIGSSLGDDKARMVRVAELGGVRVEDADPRLVLLPRFRAGSETRLERQRPGLAAMGLLESSCSQGRLKEAGLDFVLDLARRLPCWRLTYSDLDEAVGAIDELLNEVAGGAAPE